MCLLVFIQKVKNHISGIETAWKKKIKKKRMQSKELKREAVQDYSNWENLGIFYNSMLKMGDEKIKRRKKRKMTKIKKNVGASFE